MPGVRLIKGVAGESVRVVHWPAERLAMAVRTLCGEELPMSLTEVVEYGGMPCVPCVAAAAQRSSGPVGAPPDGAWELSVHRCAESWSPPAPRVVDGTIARPE